MDKKLVRFDYLKERGIADHRAQVARLVRDHEFPTGFLLSSNTRVWELEDVERWLAQRRAQAQSRPPEALTRMRQLAQQGGRAKAARARAKAHHTAATAE